MPVAAAKPKKTPKKLDPEEIWYHVHKHPEGVAGGMGKSPEHHLRNRGWSSHEIHGSSSKTIQYRNHKYPDFVISYGGGSSTKQDHNFRVMYMGANANIAKVHRAYSVAEAMDKVEELHKMSNGLVVQPMIYSSSELNFDGWPFAEVNEDGQLQCPSCKSTDLWNRDFRMYKHEPDLGCKCGERLHSPDHVTEDWERSGDAFTPDPVKMEHWAASPTADNPTMAQQPNIALDNTFRAPVMEPTRPDMTEDDYHPIGKPKTEFPTRPDKETDWQNPKPQLKEIPDPPPIKPKKGGAPRRADGQGPADLGRQLYQKRRWVERQSASDEALSKAARALGMDIKPEEVADYRGLRSVIAAFQRAANDTWEEPGGTDYYHGTVDEDLDDIQPANQHGGRVTFRSDTDPDYAYVTTNPRDAWNYAEKAWHSTGYGVPRVYRVRATGPVEVDPSHDEHGHSRSNYENDWRSRHPFEVQEELPMPEEMGEQEDWR